MIKCPNCGSTAQIKERSAVNCYGAGGQHIRHTHYECGCGTMFFHSVGYNDAGDICHTSIHEEDEQYG